MRAGAVLVLVTAVAVTCVPASAASRLPDSVRAAPERSDLTLPRGLSFEERVAAQKAIEEVYWRHRIWPRENPTAKPPLSSVMSDEEIRAKVEDYLRKSSAVERWWSRPITGAQLQAELDRMTSSTQDPSMLRELFAALGNDAPRIAETLARQTLADRLIRNWYAFDDRFHGNVRREAEAAVASTTDVAAMRAMGGGYVERTLLLRGDDEESPGYTPGGGVVKLKPDEWTHHMDVLARRFGTSREALPLGRVSGLQEDANSFFVSAVLSQSDTEAVVASVVWPKRSFDAWWSAERTASNVEITADAGPFVISAPSDGGCVDDTWRTRLYSPPPLSGHTAVWTGTEMIVWGVVLVCCEPILPAANAGARYNPATDSWLPVSGGLITPEVREGHTAVWTGTEMIVWGGLSNTGGRYNPTDDTWLPTSTGANVPSAREGHTAVWTGTEMIVWGGTDGRYYFDTGGRYHPSTDTWVPTPRGLRVPEGRAYHTAVWTGTEMIVWGGYAYRNLNTGGRYDPSRESWVWTSPSVTVWAGRTRHVALWTGTEMIIWGGRADGGSLNTGGRYNPSTDAWLPTSTGANVPEPQGWATAVWTGTEMIVWGSFTSGGRYNPSTDTWAPTSTGANAPSPRGAHTAVWTGTEMIVWGGFSFPTQLNTGGRYDPSTDTWLPTSTGANVPTAREGHTAVWTGTEMVVWGGAENNDRLSNTGGRYEPSTDTWLATSTGPNVPAATAGHTAAWTGTEMIVWGAQSDSTGGRYNPLTDTWMPTSTGANVPSPRAGHTAVWTGSQMIVWGGWGYNDPYLSTGGRYDPSTDAWLPTSTGVNVPSPRAGHTAVWTGSEMIVWGGFCYGNGGFPCFLNTGGRYDPSTDTWIATSTGPNVPDSGRHQTAVWTGSEMLVWGGFGYDGFWHVLNTGGRYDPSTDTWIATSTGVDVPEARWFHTAVWTGTEMIVWGGSDWGGYAHYFNTGGRYDPSTDTWIATSTVANVPAATAGHTAVWTGREMIVYGGETPLADVGLYCVCTDPDQDDVCGDADPFPSSDPHPTVVIDECDSGVANEWVVPGANMGDLIGQCRTDASSHGEFVSCVARLTNEWTAAGWITGREKSRIQSCSALLDSHAPGLAVRAIKERT